MKIIIIDDEIEMTNVTRTRLEMEKHQVLCAQNGKEGLKLIKEEAPDCIIVDMVMPHINGIEVCKVVRSMPIKQPKIIMITAGRIEDCESQGLEAGANHVIRKPYKSQEILKLI